MENGKRHLTNTTNELFEVTRTVRNHKDDLADPNERSLALIANFLAELNINVATVADVLEEINEKLNKKLDGDYLVCGDNLRVVHCDAGADDGR